MPPRRPVPPVAQSYHIAAPTGGKNTVSPGLQMPEGDAVSVENLISAENGLRSRLGWRQYATGLTGVSDNKVRTVLPYNGSGSTPGLFAATQSGIWTVTAGGASPTLALAFGDTSGDAGWGSFTECATPGGNFGLYCDEVNGYHVYTETGTAWAAVTMGVGAGQVAGVDPGDLVFVTVFKNRVWFVERGSNSAWYLDVDSIYGTATEFPVGQQFRAGGHLVGLWNWTYDGGAGMDDSLVMLSSGGDVLIYQGTDPDDPSAWGLKGVWYLGTPPAGRRVASSFGGELLMLARQGIAPLSRLVVSATAEDSAWTTGKIANRFNALMVTRAETLGWAIALHPEDNSILVLMPDTDDDPQRQLAQAVASKGWFEYQGLDMVCSAVWQGQLYFGTSDGTVCINTGYVDGVTLADPTGYEEIVWTLTTAFSPLGTPRQKRVTMLRPLLVSVYPFTVNAEARYDYDLTEAADYTPVLLSTTAGTWDSSTWDAANWGGNYYSVNRTLGATGTGTHVAVALRGKSVSRSVFVGVDVHFEQASGVL